MGYEIFAKAKPNSNIQQEYNISPENFEIFQSSNSLLAFGLKIGEEHFIDESIYNVKLINF